MRENSQKRVERVIFQSFRIITTLCAIMLERKVEKKRNRPVDMPQRRFRYLKMRPDCKPGYVGAIYGRLSGRPHRMF